MLEIKEALEPGQKIERAFKAAVGFHPQWLAWMSRHQSPPHEVLLEQVIIDGKEMLPTVDTAGLSLGMLMRERLAVSWLPIYEDSIVHVRMKSFSSTQTHRIHMAIGGVPIRDKEDYERYSCEGRVRVNWEPMTTLKEPRLYGDEK